MQPSKYDGSSLTNEYPVFAFFFPVHVTGCTAETNLKETLTIKQRRIGVEKYEEESKEKLKSNMMVLVEYLRTDCGRTCYNILL